MNVVYFIQKSESSLEISASAMLKYSKKFEWMVFVVLGMVIGAVICNPMYYKKTDDDTYEPGERESFRTTMTSSHTPMRYYNFFWVFFFSAKKPRFSVECLHNETFLDDSYHKSIRLACEFVVMLIWVAFLPIFHLTVVFQQVLMLTGFVSL